MNPVTSGPHAPEGAPLRVLCVDDNRDAADSTADLLRTVGFEARACYDGRSALAEAAALLPGLCLIDLHMPGMDGVELAARLCAEPGAVVPVLVALTAMGDEASCERTRAAGFRMHLVKPVDPHKLVAVVDALWRAAPS